MSSTLEFGVLKDRTIDKYSVQIIHQMSSPAVQIIDGNSFLLKAIGSGLWPALVVLSELVQTLILADFW